MRRHEKRGRPNVRHAGAPGPVKHSSGDGSGLSCAAARLSRGARGAAVRGARRRRLGGVGRRSGRAGSGARRGVLHGQHLRRQRRVPPDADAPVVQVCPAGAAGAGRLRGARGPGAAHAVGGRAPAAPQVRRQGGRSALAVGVRGSRPRAAAGPAARAGRLVLQRAPPVEPPVLGAGSARRSGHPPDRRRLSAARRRLVPAARRPGRPALLVLGGFLDGAAVGRVRQVRRGPSRHLVGELRRAPLRRPRVHHPRQVDERPLGRAAHLRRGLAQLAPRRPRLRPARRARRPARPERRPHPSPRTRRPCPRRPLARPRPPHRPPPSPPHALTRGRAARVSWCGRSG